ncbi:hypothetical protein Cal7507_4093 [Calothrix sp. PCC 7507]|nr:hypothetical protein Cal7507_4093 [Calothrix sp. PCC 7507]
MRSHLLLEALLRLLVVCQVWQPGNPIVFNNSRATTPHHYQPNRHQRTSRQC